MLGTQWRSLPESERSEIENSISQLQRVARIMIQRPSLRPIPNSVFGAILGTKPGTLRQPEPPMDDTPGIDISDQRAWDFK
jgi:hypothetical protein